MRRTPPRPSTGISQHFGGECDKLKGRIDGVKYQNMCLLAQGSQGKLGRAVKRPVNRTLTEMPAFSPVYDSLPVNLISNTEYLPRQIWGSTSAFSVAWEAHRYLALK